MNIQPTNSLEEKILSHEKVITGLEWGKPRNGHPEGQVKYHIEEVLQNVEKIKENLTQDEYDHLRLITLLHDTFKYIDQKNHALVAKEIAKEFTTDSRTLNILEYHDDAYRIGNAETV